ncbi:MAG: TonB family protein [Kofleriaceae bacterium]
MGPSPPTRSPPPPPPPPSPPKVIPPTALEQQRISGDTYIVPDDDTTVEIGRSQKAQLMIPVKVCIGRSGDVESVEILKSSGFPAYDDKVQRGVLTWKYRPFMMNGVPAPVCAILMFVYRQT